MFAYQGGEGVAVDAQGNVYIAAGQIYVYDPAGTLIDTIEVPERPHAARLRRHGRPHALHRGAHVALRGAHEARRTVDNARMLRARLHIAMAALVLPLLLVGCNETGRLPEIKKVGVFIESAGTLVEMPSSGRSEQATGPACIQSCQTTISLS